VYLPNTEMTHRENQRREAAHLELVRDELRMQRNVGVELSYSLPNLWLVIQKRESVKM
jgi:hypothetical protein